MKKDKTEFIKGMDISTLLEEEACGAVYYDGGVQKDLLQILSDHGTNSVRIRLWNDPYAEDGRAYGAGTNDLNAALTLAKRAKAFDMSILLDFHYSDFWADPGKQNVPKAWRGHGVSELIQDVYSYTKEVLLKFRDEGIAPEMIQIGNEITNGLLWPTGKKPEFDNIAAYVSAGIRAAREICPDSEIMIHLDNGGNAPMYREWFDEYLKRGEDFDIIGLSYYPFWHGTFDMLEANLDQLVERYHKKLIIAEVSMGFTMEDYAEYEKLGPNERKGYATKASLVAGLEYPMTKEGQVAFMERVIQLIQSKQGGSGFYYWEPGWIPVPGCGWATDAALEYTGEQGPCGNEWANQALFDYDGNALPALSVGQGDGFFVPF